MLGKTFLIDSTCYFHGELFDAGIAECDGVLSNLSKLRFKSISPGHMDLGADPSRERSKVFLSQDDIFTFLQKKINTLQEEKTIKFPFDLKKNQILALKASNYSIQVYCGAIKKDPYTDKEYFQAATTGGMNIRFEVTSNPSTGKVTSLSPYGNNYQLFHIKDLLWQAYIGKKQFLNAKQLKV